VEVGVISGAGAGVFTGVGVELGLAGVGVSAAAWQVVRARLNTERMSIMIFKTWFQIADSQKPGFVEKPGFYDV
jgi:hypothetical protein